MSQWTLAHYKALKLNQILATKSTNLQYESHSFARWIKPDKTPQWKEGILAWGSVLILYLPVALLKEKAKGFSILL